jgi:predicted negative regulator of RcsB-dependent stress response
MDNKTVIVALVIAILGLGLVVGIEALQISQLDHNLAGEIAFDAQVTQNQNNLNVQILGNITQLKTQSQQQYVSLPTLNGTITMLYEHRTTVQLQQSNVSIILFDNGTCKFIASQPQIYDVTQIISP